MKKICITEGKKKKYFSPDKVICVKGDGSYSDIFFQVGRGKKAWVKKRVCYTLSRVQRRLARYGVHQTNKSTLVNIDHVKEVIENDFVQLDFDCLESISLTSVYRKNFNAQLQLKF